MYFSTKVHGGLMQIQRDRYKDLAVISNTVIKSSYALEETEKKLILALLGSIKPKLVNKEQLNGGIINEQNGEVVSSTTLYTINISEYANLYGLEVFNARKLLKQAAITLFERKIVVRNGSLLTYLRWVQTVVIDDEKSIVGVVWSNDIIPFISQLSSNFTQLKLGNIAKLHGMYSSRLYELIISRYNEYGGRHNVKFNLEELYFSMAIPKSFKKYGEFKRRILLPALKNIQEVINIRLEEEFKMKYKVVELEFSVGKQTKPV